MLKYTVLPSPSWKQQIRNMKLYIHSSRHFWKLTLVLLYVMYSYAFIRTSKAVVIVSPRISCRKQIAPRIAKYTPIPEETERWSRGSNSKQRPLKMSSQSFKSVPGKSCFCRHNGFEFWQFLIMEHIFAGVQAKQTLNHRRWRSDAPAMSSRNCFFNGPETLKIVESIHLETNNNNNNNNNIPRKNKKNTSTKQ